MSGTVMCHRCGCWFNHEDTYLLAVTGGNDDGRKFLANLCDGCVDEVRTFISKKQSVYEILCPDCMEKVEHGLYGGIH